MTIARKLPCKPVSYDSVQNIVYTKQFATDQAIISLRLLNLSTDLPVIYHWLPWEYTRHLKKEAHVTHLQEIYSRIAGSGTAQSFMLLLNNATLAQADLYQAAADDISLQYTASQGDYKLQLLIKPERLLAGPQWSYALETMMEFLFSFREVKRLVMLLDEHELLNSKIGKRGFIFHKKITTRQKNSCLYLCSREQFYQSQA
ncbi:GNAT family N-acetyltransferase [Paraflavitalea sp. CAU 1676]|uniref:GNAT family N-acetyltransferase n=1 Tax=Paraflavitalea sp. CAU 1676 TaxID=3032598 RepID=UPI0023DAA997|nr:GNAT family N-acetyltransferase [Paraflavitalea sp. CAU 1676]MDF2193046.1 GNAT family N-acetyltransferase [Paraflavitalea sp. CAU 1676]